MSIKAYKGFNKDMTCRGFQFKEGETYHEENAKLCESGFHACIDPMDCFQYYKPASSVYHEVELDEITDEKTDDTKICGKTIKVGAALDIAGIVKAKIKLVFKKAKKEKNYTSGDWSSAATSGYRSSAATSGNGSSAATSGAESSAATNNKNGIALACGKNAKAKGVKGAYIVLTEWNENEDELICAKIHKVDGKTIKPDTWYTLKGGKFVEVDGTKE